MATTTDLGRVRERSSGVYTATLKDTAEVVIPLASMTSLTLTLYDVATKTIINSRSAQNVLNTNNVTYHATTGLLTWTVQSADNQMVGARELERHRAVFQFTWNSGSLRDWHAIEVTVENESKITS